jgi:hypothetical protein
MVARAATDAPPVATLPATGPGASSALRFRGRLRPAIRRGYERYLKIALALPGAEASSSYGTPAVKVRGKILSRWRTEAEGALAIRCDFLDRQILLQTQPQVFFLTDHYANHPMILMRVEKASRPLLQEVVERAWRLVASPRLVRERQQRGEQTGGSG